MTHPFIEKYMSLMSSDTMPDPQQAKQLFADDIRWHEAGSTEVLTSPEAIAERLTSMSGDATVDVQVKGGVADDDNAAIMGHATFTSGDQRLEYDFVEWYRLRDGKVAERWSFMDALPDDVKAFFG